MSFLHVSTSSRPSSEQVVSVGIQKHYIVSDMCLCGVKTILAVGIVIRFLVHNLLYLYFFVCKVRDDKWWQMIIYYWLWMCWLCGCRISSNGSCTISIQHRALSCSVALYSLRNVIRTQRSANPGRTIHPDGFGAELLLSLGTRLAPGQPNSAWGFVRQLDFGSICARYVRAVHWPTGCRPVALGTAGVHDGSRSDSNCATTQQICFFVRILVQ